MTPNNELLEYIYQVADMGVKSTTYLLNNLAKKENKIKKIVEEQLQTYKSILKDTEKELNEQEITPKSKGKMTDMMLNMSIKMAMMKDNSDAKIADMLIQGFTIGLNEINKHMNNCPRKSFCKSCKLAKKLQKFQEKNIELLKEFL